MDDGSVETEPRLAYLMPYEPVPEAYLMPYEHKASLRIVSLCTGASWTSDALQCRNYVLRITVNVGQCVNIEFLTETVYGHCYVFGSPHPITLGKREVPDFVINGRHELVLVRDDFDVMNSINQFKPPLFVGKLECQHDCISTHIMYEIIDPTTRAVAAYMSCYSDVLVKSVSFDGRMFTIHYMDWDELKVQSVESRCHSNRWIIAKKMRLYFDKPFHDMADGRPLFRIYLE